MTPNLTGFAAYEEKAINSYAIWSICTGIGTVPMAEARICVESIFKALIAKKYGLKECTLSELQYHNLVSKSEKAKPGYQIVKNICLNEGLVPNTHLPFFNAIQNYGNDYVHSYLPVNDKRAKNADQCLQKILDWYFPNIDWVKLKISPITNQLAANLSARVMHSIENSLRSLYDRLIQHQTLGKIWNNGIDYITPEYWEVLRETHDQEKISAKLLLRADESCTHPYIAFEAIENPDFLHTVKGQQLQVYWEEISEEVTIVNLIHDCFYNKRIERLLVKIFAPSGEGKTVFLSKVAYILSTEFSEKVAVYWLKSVTGTILQSLFEVLREETKPTLVFIDTPSQYESDLAVTWSLLTHYGQRFPFAVIIADQKNRYERSLLTPTQTDFEFPFQEVVRVDFALHPVDRNCLLEAIQKAVALEYPVAFNPATHGIFFSWHMRSTRENIRQYLKHIGVGKTVKHKDDWEIFYSITNYQPYHKYRDLFAFIALFSFFEVAVPLNLFDYPYIPGLNKADVLRFIDEDTQNIIRLSPEEKLLLRHEEVAKWFYEDAQNQRIGRATYEEFTRSFCEYLDPFGGYLFRKTYYQSNPKHKSFISNVLELEETKNILQLFVSQSPYNRKSKNEIAKYLMRLSAFERTPVDRLFWIEKLLGFDGDNIRSLTKKAQILIEAKDFTRAYGVLVAIRRSNQYDTAAFLVEVRYYVAICQPVPYRKLFDCLVDKTAFIKFLLREKRYNVINGVAACLNDSEEGVDEKILNMLFAVHHFSLNHFDQAVHYLRKNLDSVLDDSPSILFLFKIYYKTKNWIAAETILLESKRRIGDTKVSYDVSLAKLYREDEFKSIHNGYNKSKQLFDEISRSPVKMSSKQLRLEYAKWCYENHQDIAMQNKAIALLKGTITSIDTRHLHSRTALGIIYQSPGPLQDLNLSRLYLEECFIYENGIEEAFRVILATTYIRIGSEECKRKAIVLLESVVKEYGTNSPAVLDLIDLYLVFGELDKAEKLSSTLSGITRISSARILAMSDRYLERKSYSLALKLVESALENDDENIRFLNQAAKILIVYSQQQDSKDERNAFLQSAETYLLKADNIDNHNPITDNLLIAVYDSFQLDPTNDEEMYLKRVRQRNARMIKMSQDFPNNIYMVIIACRLLLSAHRPRAVLDILDSIEFDLFSIPDKIKILTFKKTVHIRFNDIVEIEKLNALVNEIVRDCSGNIAKEYVELTFVHRKSFVTNATHSVGALFYGKEALRDEKTGKRYSIDGTLHPELTENDRLYFCLYTETTSEGKQRSHISMTEPFFDPGTVKANLGLFLPKKLNSLNY